MKKNKKIFKNREQGITLIALVITIIVLLILAGITISALTGDNGILAQAAKAKEETEKAKTNEQTDLAKMEDLINESVNGSEVEQVTDTAPGVLERNDTETNTYTINSIEDLVFFSYDVNNGNTYEGQTIKLGLSLDFDSSKSYVDAYRTDYGKYGYNGALKTLLTSGEGFKPIGTYLNSNTSINDETNTPFMGTFDGNNHEINGLRIVSSEKGKGLFGLVKGATIKNLGIGNDSTIKVNLVSGSIVGYANEGTTIENCYNNATILESTENSQQLGGIAGQLVSSSNITNCFNLANISGGSNLGGIVGNNNNAHISSCYNIGQITGYGISVGGIAGMSLGNIDSCYNTGVLTGEERVGGIAGQQYNNDNAKISNSYNVGKINIAHIGSGIIGTLVTGKLENNFYLENIVNGGNGTPFDGSTAKTMEEMKNIYTSLGNAFKADSNNINNGYPILSWQ